MRVVAEFDDETRTGWVECGGHRYEMTDAVVSMCVLPLTDFAAGNNEGGWASKRPSQRTIVFSAVFAQPPDQVAPPAVEVLWQALHEMSQEIQDLRTCR